MKRRDSLALLAAGACIPCPTSAAQDPAPFSEEELAVACTLRNAALDDATAWRLVSALTTEIGARPAGSANDARAVAWAQQQLRALNLAAVRAEEMPLRIWQRGPASARLLAPNEQTLVMAALGNSVAAPEGGIEAEIAYYPTLAALRADTSTRGQSRAEGRIVFIDQPTERSRDGRGYSAAVSSRFQGPGEAAKRGALALAIRSLGTSGNRIAHTGAMSYDLSQPRIPAFALSTPDADLIARLHAAGQTPRMHFTLQAREGVDATTHNVIAEVPGGELAQEVVLISAHLDSWDVGQGALDDAAGVAIVSAAAGLIRRLAPTPRRTVRVVLFGNEENGFDGARRYGDRYGSVPHQLAGESDFGAGRIYRLRGRARPEAAPALAAMQGVLGPLGVAWEADNQAMPGPDAALLMRRHRWPAVALSQDGSNYFDVHHTEHDTLDKVDADALRQNVACWAVVAWLAAMAREPFGPLPPAA